MESKQKKRIIIISALIAFCICGFGIVFAILQTTDTAENKLKIGSLDVDIKNLKLVDKNNVEKVPGDTIKIQPGDINTLNFTGENVGTATALTRYTVEVYWKDVADVAEITNSNPSSLFALYPATMSNENIIADFYSENTTQTGTSNEGTNSGNTRITTETFTKEVDGKTVYGIKYKFLGDTLDGSVGPVVSNKTSQDFGFKILLSNKLSYLYQNKDIGIEITSEALQYTEQGSSNWNVTDNQGF